MKYYLYNPLANNGIAPRIEGVDLKSVVGLDYKKFFDSLNKEDEVVLIGGDGTISHLLFELEDYQIKNNIYLLANGTGNDFMNDINQPLDRIVLLNPYLKNLPIVKVNGIERRFINNMGFGIDGYCCEEADRIKAKTPNKKINYTGIAIKGLLMFFKPRHADIEIDGQHYEFDNVWLAPTMKGRYYGGGMMIAPDQDRNSDKLTVVVYACKSKLKSLIAFPSIFEGKHVEKTDMVHVFTGNKVHVKFSKPCAAQIDGDTVLNVSEYSAEL
ncbi:MAG: diacylglycerol kinase family protein [Erysipelotrichaceae bacterium]|nr:diacylglycerol kinase family protein [Erysipelotrichaceae bacterium]